MFFIVFLCMPSLEKTTFEFFRLNPKERWSRIIPDPPNSSCGLCAAGLCRPSQLLSKSSHFQGYLAVPSDKIQLNLHRAKTWCVRLGMMFLPLASVLGFNC
jgi:hypothetical protein